MERTGIRKTALSLAVAGAFAGGVSQAHAAAFAPPSVQPAAILRCLLCERLSSPHYDVTRGPAFSPLREPGEQRG